MIRIVVNNVVEITWKTCIVYFDIEELSQLNYRFIILWGAGAVKWIKHGALIQFQPWMIFNKHLDTHKTEYFHAFPIINFYYVIDRVYTNSRNSMCIDTRNVSKIWNNLKLCRVRFHEIFDET